MATYTTDDPHPREDGELSFHPAGQPWPVGPPHHYLKLRLYKRGAVVSRHVKYANGDGPYCIGQLPTMSKRTARLLVDATNFLVVVEEAWTEKK